ncbi:MAG: hydroxymethylglutaryl-CoA reductase [Lentimicrobium sp.]|jgi:hydroxymethylglutaryl-CoA reductase|nr:hydroxymethylglutaryl-CoA reductase [Lentimicrobium sp.]MDY0025386.1 hydroxymethylglutaryl-CoA reductase [Lentimicrobium sp.]
MKNKILTGFSRLSKTQKLDLIAAQLSDPDDVAATLRSFWHPQTEIQKLFDEFSENTITNYFFPYGIAPNVLINGRMHMVPMVIEESSVIAAAANSAKYWAAKGGFQAEVLSFIKNGQVHFTWDGPFQVLHSGFDELEHKLRKRTAGITANMEQRGGGVIGMELIDLSHKLPHYYQLSVKFDTRDSMGANFINSCLEEYASGLKDYVESKAELSNWKLEIVMSILSNYTPECLVKVWVESDISSFKDIDSRMSADDFVRRFEMAVNIAKVDVNRAVTHNKGIFNGIDAVVLATGNDFRAIEASGHAWAARNGQYQGLTDIKLENNRFEYSLTLPLSIGTVGGLTSLHPMAKLSLNLLKDPSAEELMQIAAVVGLANNFSALKSLTTRGIQLGHMKMHLLNILNVYKATDYEKALAVEYFKHHKVSHKAVDEFLTALRNK